MTHAVEELIAQSREALRDVIESAFPEGDLKAHHDYHVELMGQEAERKRLWLEKEEARRQIWLEVKKKVLSSLAWAILWGAIAVTLSKLYGIKLPL